MSQDAPTYVGPFGRILPILPNTKPLASEEQHAPVEGTLSSTMTTYTLPPPVGLQFGSDPFHGFLDRSSRESTSDQKSTPERSRPSPPDASRRAYHEQLPSVRQLLTPRPQPSVPISPTSPRSPDPQLSYSTQPLTRRSTFSEASSPVGSFPQPGVYAAVPVAQQFVENGAAVNGSYEGLAPLPQYQPTYANPPPPTPPTYTSYQEPPRYDPYAHHPRPIAPLTAPSQYYQAHAGSYDQSAGPTPVSGLSVRDAANNVKPLPRLAGESLIPGEGPCWVYEDGSICKKTIDGEAVNGQWGVTKAGKPRKRLAIACTTCREKKIKCDPAEPKCVQCEKFGRVCRFTTA